MALITCPTCGKTVSDKAEKCVHCGALFKHCEKCGMLFTGNGKHCRTCAKELDLRSPDEEDDTDYMEKFLTDSPKTRRMLDSFNAVNKAFKIIDWFLYGGAILLLALIFVNEDLSFAITVVMFTAVALIVAVYIGFHRIYAVLPSYLYTKDCQKWISENDLTVDKFIQKRFNVYTSTADSEAFNTLFDFSAGALYASDLAEKNKARKHFIIRSAIGCVFLLYLVLVCPYLLTYAYICESLSHVLIAAIPLVVLCISYIATFFIFTLPDSKRVRALYTDNDN